MTHSDQRGFELVTRSTLRARPPLATRWRPKRALVAFAIAVIVTCILGIPGAESSPPTKPPPENLIVGTPITLPAALFDAGNPGSSSLITPSQAQAVATAMWNAWESALAASDTRALTQLASPGAMLNGTINNCAFPNGLCLLGTQTPTLGEIQTVVPSQSSYPLYFLASIRTTNQVTTNSGLNQQEPWMDLQILTKASSTASWRLSFDSGYAAVNAAEPGFLPFDGAFGAGTTLEDRLSPYNAPVTGVPPVPTSMFLPLLASYYQSFKSEGHAPAHSVFVSGGQTTGEGQTLAEARQGSTLNGSRQTYRFAWDPGAGSWQFSVSGGYPMECGSLLDNATVTPLSGLLNQNLDETNYGIPLPAGSYLSITTAAEHEVCVYQVRSGLAVGAGGQVYSSAVTGKEAPAVLVDLDTAFGVLTSDLAEYTKQYSACSSSKTCVKEFAQNAAEQFAAFDSSLAGYAFPARLDKEAASLDATTRQLNGLYEAMYNGTDTTAALSSIESSEKALLSEYNSLVRGLS
jgi:hypothetical protein